MRGDLNFKGSDLSDFSVYFLFCAKLLNATCWRPLNTIQLDDVRLSLNLLKIFVQYSSTLFGQAFMVN